MLAGGSSKRMGINKATIVIDGQTMLDRCLDAMGEAGLSPLVVVGGNFPMSQTRSSKHVADIWPDEGPLGALVTALDNLQTALVVVMACDILAPSSAEINRLCSSMADHDAVVPVADGRDQWLHSVWNRDCLGSLRDAFESGTRSIHAATGGLDIHRVNAPDPTPYHDADTPSDLPQGWQRS